MQKIKSISLKKYFMFFGTVFLFFSLVNGLKLLSHKMEISDAAVEYME